MAASGSDRAHDSLLKRKLINNFFNYSEPFNYKHEILVASESMQCGAGAPGVVCALPEYRTLIAHLADTLFHGMPIV